MKINVKNTLFVVVFLVSTQAFALFDTVRDVVGGAVDVAAGAVEGATDVAADAVEGTVDVVTGNRRAYPERIYTDEVIAEEPIIESAPVVAAPVVAEPVVTRANGTVGVSRVIEPSIRGSRVIRR